MAGSSTSGDPFVLPARPGASARQPAPGGLELVRAFLNSSDIEAGTDAFATLAGLEAWLGAQHLAIGPSSVDAAARRRLVAFREALRDLITCRESGEADEASLLVLERTARSSPLTVAFGVDGGAVLAPTGSGLDGLVGRILSEIALGAVAGTWPRLKVCRNDACRWAFYDASRNHSGIWCSMAICGNRAKGRALRARRGGPSRTRSRD